MSCRRVAREVLEFFRFGDLDARSAPHLDHLEACQTCRDEVGLDREVVINLQRALHARVAGHEPSPQTWLEVRRRALQPPAPTWNRWLFQKIHLAPVGAVVVMLAVGVGVLAPDRPLATAVPGTPQGVRVAEGADSLRVPRVQEWWVKYMIREPAPPETGWTAWADPSWWEVDVPEISTGIPE